VLPILLQVCRSLQDFAPVKAPPSQQAYWAAGIAAGADAVVDAGANAAAGHQELECLGVTWIQGLLEFGPVFGPAQRCYRRYRWRTAAQDTAVVALRPIVCREVQERAVHHRVGDAVEEKALSRVMETIEERQEELGDWRSSNLPKSRKQGEMAWFGPGAMQCPR